MESYFNFKKRINTWQKKQKQKENDTIGLFQLVIFQKETAGIVH